MSAFGEGILTVNVVLVGDSATGAKTSLLNRFTKGTFTLFTYPTIGVAFVTKTLEVDGIQVKLEIWGLHLNACRRWSANVNTI